jgi:hypothetical protein
MTFSSILLFVSLFAAMAPNYTVRASQLIDLGECAEFAIMAGSTSTCAGAANCNVLNGYLGVSPGTSITGNWKLDSSYSSQQVGTSKSIGCAQAGLAALTQGKALSGKTLASGEMSGMTFYAGVHNFPGALSFGTANTKVTLDASGNNDAKFYFYAASTLTTAANTQLVLVNGAHPKNVYWVIGTAATLGANSWLKGSIIAGSAITLGTGAHLHGRAIAQTAVTCETACKVLMASP